MATTNIAITKSGISCLLTTENATAAEELRPWLKKQGCRVGPIFETAAGELAFFVYSRELNLGKLIAQHGGFHVGPPKVPMKQVSSVISTTPSTKAIRVHVLSSRIDSSSSWYTENSEAWHVVVLDKTQWRESKQEDRDIILYDCAICAVPLSAVVKRHEHTPIYLIGVEELTQPKLAVSSSRIIGAHEGVPKTRHFRECLQYAYHQATLIRNLQKRLQERKLIERAKSLLMKHLSIDEPEAFRMLQKFASSENKKMIEIAAIIVTASEALIR